MKQTFKFLSSTGRRLRSTLTKIAYQFSRRGSATLKIKIKIKIPLLFEAEIGVETGWDRDRAR